MLPPRILGLTAFVVLAASHATPATQDSETAAAVKRQKDLFQVTECHARGDTLYCIHEGDEWEVTSDVDVGNAPDRYSGCYDHSDTELWVFILQLDNGRTTDSL